MKDRWRWRLLAFQSAYYGLTGTWPILHLASFEAVTGPKTDDWWSTWSDCSLPQSAWC